MARDTGKVTVLGHIAQVILSMVLADGLNVPKHEDLVDMSCDSGCVHQFVIGVPVLK